MNYRKLTLITIALAFGLYSYIAVLSPQKITNYRLPDQVQFNNHLIENDKTSKPKIFFLGSSCIAGSNIPPETTLVDYFNKITPSYRSYNLAANKGKIIDAKIIIDKFSHMSPVITVLGIEPMDFRGPIETPLSLEYSPKSHLNFKEKLQSFFYEAPVPPQGFQISWKTFIYNLRISFWGPLFFRNLYRPTLSQRSESEEAWLIFESFIKAAHEHKSWPVIVLHPILQNNINEEIMNSLKTRIKIKSEELNFTFIDYTSLLPSTHEYFYDYSHYTPKGYEQLARQLNNDLTRMKLISQGGQ